MAAAGLLLVVCAAVVAALVETAHACDGYSLQDVSIKPCPGSAETNLIFAKDVKPEFTPDCKVRISGCVMINKTSAAPKVSYVVKKDNMLLNKADDKDVCEFLEEHRSDQDMQTLFEAFQLPRECPIPVGQVCGNGKTIDLGGYKSKLGLLVGSYTARSQFDNGDGPKSCLDYAFKIKGKMSFL